MPRHEAQPWNHNIHYHKLIRRAIPPSCQRALDVGCGEGTLARELAEIIPSVTAIDVDERSIARCRVDAQASDVSYILADFLTYDFTPESFQLVCSVATLHHVDSTAALVKMRDLVAPGGVVVVVGLARSSGPIDLMFDVAGTVVHKALMRTRTYWEHGAPTLWPPPEDFRRVRAIARQVLPGVRFRRHLLWRYSLTWRKPATRAELD